MAKKSVACTELVKLAKSMAEENNAVLVTEYFLIAFFTVCKEIGKSDFSLIKVDKSRIANEIESAKIISEMLVEKNGKESLNKLREIFANPEQMLQSIKEKLTTNSDMIVKTSFSTLMRNATKKAISRGEEYVYLSTVMEILIENPTPIISMLFDKILPKPQQEPEQKPTFTVANAEEKDEDRFSDFNFDVDEEEIIKDDRPGNERLAEVVWKAKEIQNTLLQTIYGQDHAISTFVSGYFQAEVLSILNSQSVKPKATFLFAGPPGVGKTFLAEQAATALGKPFRRFDMSEYSDKEANIEFCGVSKSYKSAEPGTVTNYVAENPNAVLLFDEIEKAHLNVIHLFLQILDAGRIRDNYTDEEVSFKDTVIIFTTNAGKQLYEDESIPTLSAVPQKSIINALLTDINPVTNAPYFPRAIGSRFASNNIVMFNNLKSRHLVKIIEREFSKQTKAFEEKIGYRVKVDRNVPYSIMYAEGGRADARSISGKAGNFIYNELYELLRLVQAKATYCGVTALEEIKIEVELPKDEQLKIMFEENVNPDILVFAKEKSRKEYIKSGEGFAFKFADNYLEAVDIIKEKTPSFVIIEVKDFVTDDSELLNIEDEENECRAFINYLTDNVSVPYYIAEQKGNEISPEEKLTFLQNGAYGVITKKAPGQLLKDKLHEIALEIVQQKHLFDLARANKVLSFKTKQTLSQNYTKATIKLFDHCLKRAVDAEDSKQIYTSSVSNIKFEDVIGAKDAKDELKYFIEFLKDPVKFVRNGVKAPKGVLLYGPPGTGKTLLAKAMSGESDVTFISAEGNQFVKSYKGEGAQSIHDIFRVARKYAPSILFIDEIDAVGQNRSTTSDSSSALTALLTEMDGFKSTTDRPVFVLAATNYQVDQNSFRSLDPALVRRFDRKILVDLPSKKDRIKFIEFKISKSKNIALSKMEIENIADRSTGMSLADLDAVFEYALRNAVKNKNYTVDDKGIEEAFETYVSGEERKWDSSLLKRVAVHEAGHAFICWLTGETPTYLTIVARGDHGGYMQHASKEGKAIFTKKELLDRIKVSLGGRAAELAVYGEEEGLSTGASGDLESATKNAENMLVYYGMDESVGLSVIGENQRNSQNFIAVREKVNKILSEQLLLAVKALKENQSALMKLVDKLMEKNNLKGVEIEEILSNETDRNKFKF